MTEPLFGSWLSETKRFQREVYDFDFDAMTSNDKKRYLMEMTFALIAEASELSAEFPWKSWAKDFDVRDDAVVGESVDVLHFAANLLCAVGCTDEELELRYRDKMRINAARQKRPYGYSTTEGKCPSCRRALDDSAVRCTEEVCADE